MFLYADNCTEALMLSRTAFFGLYDNYRKLDKEATELADSLDQATIERAAAMAEAEKQRSRKKGWRGVAIGEGVGIIGAVVLAILFF
jgi:ElaB/YqjD/DUF883 family membrane-anchored ribosome-binding protein